MICSSEMSLESLGFKEMLCFNEFYNVLMEYFYEFFKRIDFIIECFNELYDVFMNCFILIVLMNCFLLIVLVNCFMNWLL